VLKTTEDIISELCSGQLQEHRHHNVELKESWDKKYGKDISALGNKIQECLFWLVIGVKDDGSIAGMTEKKARQFEQVVSQHINDYLDPVQACTKVSCHDIDGSWIIVICIKNPGDVVYWDNAAYTASGTTSRDLKPDEILELRIKLPGLTDYSSQVVSSSYDTNLINDFIKNVLRTGNCMEVGDDPLDSLKKLSIHEKQVARILFGNCSFRMIKFDEDNEPVTNIRCHGLYQLLTDEFQEKIQSWTAEQSASNTHAYPKKALKEALANAVAHAAYFEQDGDLILELYPDHLIISNLCLRNSVYFANRWFSRSHKTVNSLLMEVLRISQQVDELGRGKNLIFSESIRNGKRQPEVLIEKAGKYERWKLVLFSETSNEVLLRLLARIREVYKEEQKSLIAFALVLWRHKKVEEIRNYIDGDFSRQFAEVLSSLDGPIIYDEQGDRILLTRWAMVLLGEGLNSKGLSSAEEKRLKEIAYDLCCEYHEAEITPERLRSLAQMGNTPSERSLSSKILTSWEKDGLLRKERKGHYRWIKKTGEPDKNVLLTRLKKLFEIGKNLEF
jgi:predicted HTH transcriptional regulator